VSDKDHDFGSLVCVYAQLLPIIRESAKPLGYAIGIHGSMRGDFDLIACPWTEDAAPAEDLIKAIAEHVRGFVVGRDGSVASQRGTVMPEATVKPHGRRTWNVCWGGIIRLDVSVMPRTGD
jgi:hypothetical protein